MANGDLLKNGIIDQCAKEAMSEFNKKSWRGCSPNALMLVLYAIEKGRDRLLAKKVTRPIYWLVSVLAGGLAWMILRDILFRGGS
jgi:hypothetical protein